MISQCHSQLTHCGPAMPYCIIYLDHGHWQIQHPTIKFFTMRAITSLPFRVNTMAADDLVIQGASYPGIFQFQHHKGVNLGGCLVSILQLSHNLTPEKLHNTSALHATGGDKANPSLQQEYSGSQPILLNILRDHFGYAPSQWEMTLQCNVIPHWLA